ncbi:3404_t:CDS:2 [Diversispora eburnea]|uniref:3404_t:CDS:1 n=1 Tax=Diversispora eburnea TaxID=1213867 RepID=A0A9N8WGI0_9GLOM|nr:3404_t:CDS:2 [Diversispora eburnea]
MHSSTLKATFSVVVIVLLLFSLQVVAEEDIELWEREPQNSANTPSSTTSGPTSSRSNSSSNRSTPAPTTTSDEYGPTIQNSTTSSSSPSGTNKPSNSTNTGKANNTYTGGLPVASTIPMSAVLISVTEPASQKNILCKIGSNITFGWKYLSSFGPNLTPKEIRVYAQSNLDTKTWYNISNNSSGDTTEVIWDTSTETSLPMATYKLYICDERGLTAQPTNGRLAVFAGGLQFGMYTPRESVPLDEYQCPTCNTAGFSIPYLPLLVTFGVSLITIFIFGSGLP